MLDPHAAPCKTIGPEIIWNIFILDGGYASMTTEIIHPEIINPGKRPGLIILCEHASNFIPPVYEGLGLSRKHLIDHIAWDIGTEAVTRKMAEMMEVPAVLAKVSRLVIDCNREPDRHGLVPEVSDGIDIPGNRGLDLSARQARISAYYTPFHRAANTLVQAHLKAGIRPLVVGMHSFTSQMDGIKRPWQVGFLYNKDPRLAEAMMGLMERETDLCIGNNQPYSGKDLYYTMERHGAAHGLAQTTMEVRQDMLKTEAQTTEWAALLADCLDECMQRSDLRG